ncbi:MAG: phosphonate C-P lyase system protein PhnH [Symploca sp. SIO1C4]|uniref:Phosphonate C-P lyase system protein PhnH n=1 Tax=Symploca sp. SIO1C4 TaxID=2607765 RepID=A0A6B3N508_9CYAN|nr:phosphonate C-P lyase system protein PhnH [Symploca sp. SIO1C4]
MLQVDLAGIWQDEVQQQIFRQLLSCMSIPGTIADLSLYLGESTALVGVLATLLDNTVTLHDMHELVSQRDRRFLNSPTSTLSEARFIAADGAIAPDANFSPHLGTLASPELGATIVLQGQYLGSGQLTLSLTGPGISSAKENKVALNGFHGAWFSRRQEWVSAFPLGIDLILVDATQVMIIPRTTQIADAGTRRRGEGETRGHGDSK